VFNAESLERAVAAVLQEILLDWPELESRLLDHVKSQIEAAGQKDALLQSKRKQRNEVAEQLKLYLRTLSPKTQEEMKPEIGRLEAQRDSLDADIEAIEKVQDVMHLDPHAITTAVKSRLSDLAHSVTSLPPNVAKQTLAALTSAITADMETKAVDFEFHLPSWLIFDAESDLSQMCMRNNREFSSGTQTQRDSGRFLLLGSGTCKYIYPSHQSVDCQCVRRPRRAA
jgi:hypothetical protein